MRIAITSQDFKTVTSHAGKARRFLIFDVPPGAEPKEVDRLDLPRELSFHEFAGGPHPVDGVDAILTAGAGGGFIRKMAERGIRVVVTAETDPLQALQDLPGSRTTSSCSASPDHCCGDHGER